MLSFIFAIIQALPKMRPARVVLAQEEALEASPAIPCKVVGLEFKGTVCIWHHIDFLKLTPNAPNCYVSFDVQPLPRMLLKWDLPNLVAVAALVASVIRTLCNNSLSKLLNR